MKLYRKFIAWCEANDIKAHFYIMLVGGLFTIPLTLTIRELWHLGIYSFVLAVVATFVVGSSIIFGRELKNKTGFSKTDVLNGYIGIFTGYVISAVVLMTISFVEAFEKQF